MSNKSFSTYGKNFQAAIRETHNLTIRSAIFQAELRCMQKQERAKFLLRKLKLTQKSKKESGSKFDSK